MALIYKPLIVGQVYKVVVNGKSYPNIFTKIIDDNGDVVYNQGHPSNEIHPGIDAGFLVDGLVVSVKIGNLQSVYTEKMFKDGWITPAYNEAKKQFEIRYRKSKYSCEYTVVGTSKK